MTANLFESFQLGELSPANRKEADSSMFYGGDEKGYTDNPKYGQEQIAREV
jgi:hypothetical protein